MNCEAIAKPVIHVSPIDLGRGLVVTKAVYLDLVLIHDNSLCLPAVITTIGTEV